VFAAPAPTGAFAITAGEPNHDFVSVLGLTTDDVLIQLPPVTKASIAGGVKGTVDFTNVTGMGQLSVSLSGSSLPTPLLSFDPAALFGGDIFTVSVANPMGGGQTKVPVPSGTTIDVTFAGMTFPLKDTYYARATTGVHAAWSFGGKLDLSVLTGGGAGGIMGGNIIGAILPYLQRFDHGVRPVVDVVALPEVMNTANINGDGNATEMVPDYANFPAVALAPDTAQSLRYYIQVAPLPAVSGGTANSLIVVAGMLLPGIGFVPLGLDGQNTMNGSAIVPAFTTKVAPPHGGLEVGDYAVLATAVRLTPGTLPGPGSARLFVGSRLPETIDLSDGWVNSPTTAAYNGMMRTMSIPAVANAGYYRIVFANPDGGWQVYVPATDTQLSALPIPAAPMGLVDRTASGTVSVDAVQLGAQGATSLFDVSSGGTIALDRATKGFARAIVRH
jgi:hypothetical protein